MPLHDKPSKDPRAALHSTAHLQVSSSCAGWPQFPFLVNFCNYLRFGGSLPSRWGGTVLQCGMHFSDGAYSAFDLAQCVSGYWG